MNRTFVCSVACVGALLMVAGAAWGASPKSTPIGDVLRQPLPPEDLNVAQTDSSIVIEGPTFRYTISKGSGVVVGLEAVQDGDVVARLRGPADILVDGLRLSDCDAATTRILTDGRDLVTTETTGTLAIGAAYVLRHTFYNDGVLVTEVALTPKADLTIREGIRYEAPVEGGFTQYLHKRRDTNGMDCLKGALPGTGSVVDLPTLTSCLEVFGTDAALAVFTDRGGTYRRPADAATASLIVEEKTADGASCVLTQHLVRIGQGGEGFTVRKGETFAFRVGMAVAPNRLPHPRWRDLRMFIWAGDGKNPYPSDEEIREVARLGFTLFQMHRLGTPGEPRPPEGELGRVLKTVHDAGMLFIWTANADLMYANAPGVAALKSEGRWSAWQGFNYGGAYKARMDAYCDMVATCLASPNGLADYRMECIGRMLERYPVDGMYIDDNLPYANCTLWKEHGHPEAVYDCLIELHDVSWRRRQALKAACPHAVLIDHCSQGIILPAISAFDCHLFGEGYSFPSIEAYWDTFGTLQNMPAQGHLWPGDTESTRCAAEVAYGFDLLTGGGQYNYLDWRLWPDKLPYAAGVSPEEVLFVKGYNLAQYYFGLYESEPHYFARSKERFAATAPNTYATMYHNLTWNDALVVVANMGEQAVDTDVRFTGPMTGPFAGNGRLAVFDVTGRTNTEGSAADVLKVFEGLSLAKHETRLLYARTLPENAAYHLWGGKRIAEEWDSPTRTLRVVLDGPPGLKDCVLLGCPGVTIKEVTVDGVATPFHVDGERAVVHGTVTFDRDPITLEAVCGDVALAERPLEPHPLGEKYR